MGLLKFHNPFVFLVLIMLLGESNLCCSEILVDFDQTPPERTRFSTAVFKYSVKRPDGSDACEKNECSVHCKIDRRTLRKCPTGVIMFKNLSKNHEHKFLLNVTTHKGERNSSFYSWFIDTIPPTATISSKQNYTSARKITVDVEFSEACSGKRGGLKCVNSSDCDVIVNGPARVHPSSLKIIKPYIKYSIDMVLFSESLYGRVVIRMADKICRDKAGNPLTRTNSSILIIHFDRRPVQVDLWVSVPFYMLEINRTPRTVRATNKIEDLRIFADFNIPLMNSTEEIQHAFGLNVGKVMAVHGMRHMNRRFVFEIKNIPKTGIITVQLQGGLLKGITGTPVLPVPALTFLYDSAKPETRLSTTSPRITKVPNIDVVVEFTKPVFGFEASMVDVDGGRLTRFKELSRALYSLTVEAFTQKLVSISVPAGKVKDISGNLNSASERLEVKHYSMPAISTTLHSFVTVGVLATSLSAAILSISTSNLGAISNHRSGSTSFASSNPSMNLHGMIGHLQVFVLSDWLTANQPIEYSETTKGLRWLIPRQKLPWRKDTSSFWPNPVNLANEKLTDLNHSSYILQELWFPDENNPKFGSPNELYNISMQNTPYALPLNSIEYFTYFLRGEPLSADNVVKKIENYKGWHDMAMNLFWLGVGGGSLILIHLATLLFLRWRLGTQARGILEFPGLELFLLILMLPCISQSSAFVIRGGSTNGIIMGALLLAIPAALILSIILFLVINVFPRSFPQYKEVRHRVAINKPWYKKLCFLVTGRTSTGKWYYRGGLPSFFIPIFQILFENQKGPPSFVFINDNDPSRIPKSVESNQSGIGRMRMVSSDHNNNEEIQIHSFNKVLGCARSSYIVFDLLRRIILGVVSGAYSSAHSSQNTIALSLTVIQFISLITLKPFIRRGVHIVESISLLCEIGVFSLCTALRNTTSKNPSESKIFGFLMLALLIVSFLAQVINEWYSLLKCILRLSRPQRYSFMLGLRFVAKGLLLPFLPRSSVSTSQTSDLAPDLPPSLETECSQRDVAKGDMRGETSEDRYNAMSATVVPVLSPSSPGPLDIESSLGPSTEGRRVKGMKLKPKSEMKKLREMAKASFSVESTS